MASRYVGYEFLRGLLSLPAFKAPPLACVEAVGRVSPFGDDILAIPSTVAPPADARPLEHLLFALKHEDMNLQIAIPALRHITAEEILAAFQARPSGRYVRVAAYLWELAWQQALPTDVPAAGPYVSVFDPSCFLTGAVQRCPRWRVDFNGLGASPAYSPSVRRTPAIQALLDNCILDQAQAFLASIPRDILERAVQWAYLGETEHSYGIERESAPADKRAAFATLLARAHESEALSEDRLVAWQNLAVTNPVDRAAGFRATQNWLRRDRRITYLPPPPEAVEPLMGQLMQMANQPDPGVDALVRAAIVSFGFVFVHPFQDGNGRLSRFLFHKVACQDGRLGRGLVLPVSIAMKRHEDQYLQALESFSRPARDFWDVTDVGQRVWASFRGSDTLYRYWDATACVEFGLRMAAEALQHDLREEGRFLMRFDRVYKAVDEAVDMNNNDLVLLVHGVLAQQGRLSAHRRKQLLARGHAQHLIDEAAAAAQAAFAGAESS